jgi:hypothetical protein
VSTTRDGNWRFETRQTPHLFQHNDGFREVKLSAEASVTLDGVSYSLQKLMDEKKEIYFTTIQIEDKEVCLKSTAHKAVAVSQRGILSIYYAPSGLDKSRESTPLKEGVSKKN